MASNLPANTPDTSGLVPEKPVQRAAELLAATKAYLTVHPEQVIPQGASPWMNNSALQGVPFIIVSQWMYRTAQGVNGPWEQVQVYVCEVNLDDPDPNRWTIDEPQLATLHGKAVLNQFRSFTVGDLIGSGIFTIGTHQYKPNQNPAWVLKRYQHGIDKIPGDEDAPPSPFDGDARVSVPGVDTTRTERSATYEARVADQERARAVATPATPVLDSTPTYTNGAYDPESELAARGMTWEDAIRVSGWTTVRDKRQAQWEQFFQLYDRMMALKEIPAGSNVGQAAEQVKTRRSGPRASRQDQP